MITTCLVSLALACVARALPSTPADGPQAPRNLRLEYLVDPLGIDERKPRFSWEVDDPRRGAKQSAWRILVARAEAELELDKGSLWDSGKVVSDATAQVEYAGPDLQAGQHCWWKVQSFDAEGKPSPWSAVAHWSMGPLEVGDWKARWIGDPTPATEFQPGSRGWSSAFSATEDDPKWIQFDIGPRTAWNTVKLYPARSDDGTDQPFFLFPIRFSVWGSDHPEFDDLKKCFRVVDQSGFDVAVPRNGPLEVHTTSRMTMRYCRIVVHRLAKDANRGFGAAFAEVEVLDNGVDVSKGKPMSCSDERAGDGWSLQSVSDGQRESRAGHGDEPLAQPALRREFEVAAPLARATLTCSALGLYDARINGKRVSLDELAPGWTDYKKRVPYQTYDVTALVAQGRNAIGVQLADGWFAGRIGLAQNFVGGPTRGLYGRRPAFVAQLELVYADGKREWVTSDESWKTTLAGPLLAADLFDGESWDARKELAGFDRAGYDDSSWTKAQPVGPRASLNAERGTPVRVIEELQPRSVKELVPGTWIYDFGRNVAGWCRLEASAPAGTALVLRHAEALDDTGALYTANLRTAKQTDRYVFKGGGPERWEPRFTSHGFRYVEARGTATAPALVARVVGNSAPATAEFHAQHPVLTALWANIETTLRANIQSVPSDCPQRDERLGWMGDIQAFAPTALYLRDLGAFFTQWLQTVRDGFSRSRKFSDFSPNPFDPETDFSGAPGWADAGVFVPYACLQYYGDTRLASISLATCTRWLEQIDLANPDGLWKQDRGNDYGDWLNGSMIAAPGWDPNGCEVDKQLFATAMWARSCEMTGEMAAALGKNDVVEKVFQLHDKVKAAFQQAYVQADGTIGNDTQAGYALALAFDLVPRDLVPLAQAKLSVAITEKHAWHMTTGMQSTHRMLLELSKRGYEEVASRLVRSREFPSWGWQQEQGATSIWERWDGWMPGRGFQDPSMNSFNHFAFGSVGEWLMRCVAGIEPDPEAPGFARFRIEPRAGIQIPGAGGRYHSIRGWIESDWRIEGDRFLLDVTVPANTSATVVLPARGIESVREGGKSVLEAAPHVLPLGFEKGKASFDVRAGKYRFESQFTLAGAK